MDADVVAGERLAAEGGRLRLLLLHLAGPAIRRRVEVDDLVQEVYLRALCLPGGLPESVPGEGPLRALLARVARNTVVDVARALRSLKREAREVGLERSSWSRAGAASTGIASRLAAPGAGPATLAAGRESGALLSESFQRLRPEHRRVIGLRQFEGLSAAEAGRRMGRSEGAVHSLYRRALEAWQADYGP